MRDPSLMHTRIGLLSSETCMTIAAAKPPGLIITSLISPHPTLTTIAFRYLIIIIGCSQCSLYTTALTMLLHVIKSLWSHQSVPMVGRSTQQSWTLFSVTALHSWQSDWCIPWYWSNWYSWLCTGRWCVHHHKHWRTIWRARWKCNNIFSYWEGLTILETPGTNPSNDSKSVCTEPTVDTNDSFDCTNDDEVILSLFPELIEFVSDLESELEASMDEAFRLNSDYCPSVATAPTIPMPSLLDTKNQSNVMFPSECHLTLYPTVDCIV